MTHKAWVAAFRDMQRRHAEDMRRMDDEMDSIEFPELGRLRPATAADIVVDAVLFYPDTSDHAASWWCVVDEVLNPASDFKAFVDLSGCRHGLHGAHVLNNAKPPRRALGS